MKVIGVNFFLKHSVYVCTVGLLLHLLLENFKNLSVVDEIMKFDGLFWGPCLAVMHLQLL